MVERFVKRLAAIVAALILMAACPVVAEEMVVMTVPSFDGSAAKTQEQLDAEAGEWYETAVLNADNSVTYTLSRTTRDAMVKDIVAGFDKTHSEMIGSEDYPNFVSIDRDEDLTSFRIGFDGSDLGLGDIFVAMQFMIEGGLYQAMMEVENAEVVVTYFNVHTGEVIHQISTSDMAN